MYAPTWQCHKNDFKINKKIAQDIPNELAKYLWLGTKFYVTKNDAQAHRNKILQY